MSAEEKEKMWNKMCECKKQAIRVKEKQGVQLIFLSPFLKTKKNKNFLGVIKFNLLTHLTKKKIIALGGINKDNINKLKMTNAHGYSGISYFFDKV